MSELLPRHFSCRRPSEGGDLSQHFAEAPASAGVTRAARRRRRREGGVLSGLLAAIAALARAVRAPRGRRAAPGGEARPVTLPSRGDAP